MRIIDLISFLLLIIFGSVYILKLIFLKKRDKIDANVLGKGNKAVSICRVEMFVRITSSIWLMSWICEIIFHNQILSVLGFFFNNINLSYVGIIITALGTCIFIIAIIIMKNSWRVGIDKNTKTTLITKGIYKYSRNPAFVGFNLMSIGVFITYANILTLLILISYMVALHLLILQEEKHLLSMFGDEYKRYMEKVPRYFWLL